MVSYAGTDLTPLKRRTVTTIEKLFTRRKITSAVDKYNASEVAEHNYFRTVAEIMELDISVKFHAKNAIPKTGPLVVIANHPYGIIDGLAIAAVIEKVRHDLKIIVWDAIDVPAPPRHFIPLDLTENSFKARKQNAVMRRQSVDYLKNGGAILIFPSGSAERSVHPMGKPCELPWTPLAGRLALDSSAQVLPVFVGGHNSRLFHAASFLGDTVRRGLFLHETARLMGTSINLSFSPMIHSETITAIGNPSDVCQHLRQNVYWDHKAPSFNSHAPSPTEYTIARNYPDEELLSTRSIGAG